ncbi:AGC protein kinase [Phytophthora nicotianae CJ01A1]|uniref:AGC protein kinase n=2 Tax=Phytophthora nicotianae TaxID=4792 RepID=V9E3K4_PHYNI|nr:AGC protein kinase [Phytophthora nicotianae P1569]ETP02701.1 AGC protein kinase [Phytophthora nicotianae CJ01A1]
MHSPHTSSGRRGSVALSSSASAEDSCLFVDNLIRGVQQRLRSELGFREVVVATGEEADTVMDSGRSRTLLATSILNDHESPSKSEEPQPWEATAASKRQLLYGKDVDRKNSDASLCSECAKGTVYVSDGYENKQRLLVIVPYREAGIWSRSICMNQFDSDSDSGSMMSYLKKALSENYGVVIMNPAAQSCHPRAHVESAWDQLIAPLISEVFIVAFSRGAQMVLHLLNYDNGLGVMQDRVKALALVEPSHYVSDSDTYFARRMLARRAVSWILNSEIDVGCKIPQGHTRHGCVCVSAGTVPSNVLGSSGAYALEMVKSSVFGSFAARCGEAAGITVNANKINACGICHRKLSMLNRRIPCSWCEVKYCSRCCEDKFVPAFGSWRVCSLCQSLPCLIDPRRKNRSATNHTSPTAAGQERCSVFIRPTADDDDPVCLGDFEIVKLVGRGACGRVKLVRKKHGYDEGVFYAMKAIRKKLVIQRGLVEATNAERRILDRIKHPYVATLCYAFQTEAKLYLLSKYYPGGNLLDQMRLARRFTEDRTRLYTAEVALAIRHLHQNDIIYRDLKLENVLVDSDGHVALTDFGMSKENMPDEGRTTTFVGTYQMMAPEVFSGKSYSRAVDWWALGVMVYEMIDGRTPFNAKTNRLIKERIVNVDLKFSPRFTEDAKDFVSKLLTKNEDNRLGSGEHGFEHIKHHPWFKGLDWDSVERKEALFEGQYALMEKHAKEYRTEDIFETYMNTVEVPIDTPASVKSSNDELFNDFAFNYMDGPDEEQRDVPEPDEEGDTESPLSPVSPDGSTERSSKPRPLTVREDKMLDTFLSTNGSHFDLTLLRPNQATDFGVSGCSSLSSEGTDDEGAEPVEQLDDLETTKKDKKDKKDKKPSSPTTQPVSPSSNDGTDVDSVLTKTGSNSTDATEEASKAE